MWQTLTAVWAGRGTDLQLFRWCVGSALALIAVYLGCFLTNVYQHPGVGIAVWLFVSFAVAAAWAYPLLTGNLATIAGHIKNYALILANVEIWICVAFMAVVFPDFSKRPELFFLMAFGITLISLAFTWGHTESWTKPLVYWGTVAFMVCAITYTIVSTVWYPVFGGTMFLSSSETREAEQKVEQLLVLEKEREAVLRVTILGKPEAERTSDEVQFLEEHGDTSLLGKIREIFGSKKASAATSKIDKFIEVTKECPFFDENGKKLGVLGVGDRAVVIKKYTKSFRAMFPNEAGKYINGPIINISAENVRVVESEPDVVATAFDSSAPAPEYIPAETPAPAPDPVLEKDSAADEPIITAGAWEMFWEKTPTYKGTMPEQRRHTENVAVTVAGSTVTFTGNSTCIGDVASDTISGTCSGGARFKVTKKTSTLFVGDVEGNFLRFTKL